MRKEKSFGVKDIDKLKKLLANAGAKLIKFGLYKIKTRKEITK